MLEVTVVNEAIGQTVIVKMDGYDKLTAAAARAARDMAYGKGAYVTVSDGDTTYRVTRSTRKVQWPEGY